jgi:hypothetical protein
MAASAPRTIEYEIDVLDEEYLRHGDIGLLARLFKPRGQGPFPAVVELHRGASAIAFKTLGSTSNWHAAASWWPRLISAFRRRPLTPAR